MRARRLLFAFGLVLVPAVAHADPPPADRALAETLFRQAREAAGKGDYAVACPKFAESQRLDPRTGTLVYLATCHEQQGLTATAWVEWTEAVDLAHRSKQPDREVLARARAGRLEPNLSRIAITSATAPDGLEVELDGKPIGKATFGAPLPVDPGDHVVTVKAPGRRTYSQKVSIRAGATTVAVQIPELESDAPPIVVASARPKPAPIVVSKPPPESANNGRQILGLGIAGVGLVSLGAGAFFGMRAASLKSDADRECADNRCTPNGLANDQDARSAATMSTVGFIVGLAGLGAGTYLVLTSSKKSEAKTVVVPTASAGGGGLLVRGAF